MNIQQKKNGWFFSKSILDEINSVPDEVLEQEEVTGPDKRMIPEEKVPQRKEEQWKSEVRTDSASSGEVAKLQQSLAENEQVFSKYKRDVAQEKQRLIKEREHYKQLLTEKERMFEEYKKEAALEKQLLRDESENYKQSFLMHGDESSQQRIQVQELEEENQRLRLRLRQAIQRLQDNSESEEAKEELKRVQDEKEKQLEEVLTHLHTVEQELLATREEYQALAEQKQAENKAPEADKIEKLEQEMEQLKQDSVYSQKEIGEVLFSVRQQANHMVEKARFDVQQMIQSSEAEFQAIHDRAKEFSYELDESRQAILKVYDELQGRVKQLSKNKLTSDLSKESLDYSKINEPFM